MKRKDETDRNYHSFDDSNIRYSLDNLYKFHTKICKHNGDNTVDAYTWIFVEYTK